MVDQHSSSSCSPIKRPSSTSVEEEHITSSTACLEQNSNIMPLSQLQLHNSTHHKMAMLSNAAAAFAVEHAHNHYSTSSSTSVHDEGYNTQGYYGANLHLHHNLHHNLHHHLSSASTTPKKPKPLRSLRTKIKRKAPWMR